jgi:hypothetical protein
VRNSFPRPRAAPVTTHVLPSREKEERVIRVRRCRVVVNGLRIDVPSRLRRAAGARKEAIAKGRVRGLEEI